VLSVTGGDVAIPDKDYTDSDGVVKSVAAFAPIVCTPQAAPPYPVNWERNPDWPAVTPYAVGEEGFRGLVQIFENGEENEVPITVSSGCLIDWGDTNSDVSAGTIIVHEYDYASLAGPILTDVWTGEDYKTVLVEITGTITSLELTREVTVNNRGPVYYLDMAGRFPNFAGGFRFVNTGLSASDCFPSCEIVKIPETPSGPATFRNRLPSIRVLEFDFNQTNSFQQYFIGIGPIDEMPDIIAPNVTAAMTTMAQDSLVRKWGDVICVNNTGTAAMAFSGAKGYSIGHVHVGSTTLTQQMFQNSNFRNVIQLTADSTQRIDSILNGSLSRGLIMNSAANVTNTNGAFTNARNLTVAVLPGLTRGVSFAGTRIGNYGMNLFANALGTAAGSQDITVTNTPFGQLLSASDATALAIAAVITGKGFGIIN
jgi:hypothetical protein